MDFDPYLDWLDVGRDDALSNHYKLLGLALFEQDPAKIHGAYTAAMAKLHRWEFSKHAEVAHQLLDQISAAFVCLHDSTTKQQYDQQLRSRDTIADAIAATETLADTEDAAPRPITSLPDAIIDDQPVAAEEPIAAREPAPIPEPAAVPARSLEPQRTLHQYLPFFVVGVSAAVVLIVLVGSAIRRSSPPNLELVAGQPSAHNTEGPGNESARANGRLETGNPSVESSSADDITVIGDAGTVAQEDVPQPRLLIPWGLELLSDGFPRGADVSFVSLGSARDPGPDDSSEGKVAGDGPFVLSEIEPHTYSVYLHGWADLELVASPSRSDLEVLIRKLNDDQRLDRYRVYVDGVRLMGELDSSDGPDAEAFRSGLSGCVVELRKRSKDAILLIPLFPPGRHDLRVPDSGTHACLPKNSLARAVSVPFLAGGQVVFVDGFVAQFGQDWEQLEPTDVWDLRKVAQARGLTSAKVQLRRSHEVLELGVACETDSYDDKRSQLSTVSAGFRRQIAELQRLEGSVSVLDVTGDGGEPVTQLARLLGREPPEAPPPRRAEPKKNNFVRPGFGRAQVLAGNRAFKAASTEYRRQRYLRINRLPRYKEELQELLQLSEQRRLDFEKSIRDAEETERQIAAAARRATSWQELTAHVYQQVEVRGQQFRVAVADVVVTRDVVQGE